MDVDSEEKVGAITVELDVMGPENGSTRGKRKAVKPAIKEDESSDSEAPLVSQHSTRLDIMMLILHSPNVASPMA